jgi:hypothetical protein
MSQGKSREIPKVLVSRDIAPLIDLKKRIKVYRNLNNGMLSVVQSGLVVCHAYNCVMRDCRFLVGESGRQKVLREKRKNVHAYVSGYLYTEPAGLPAFDWKSVHYSPYRSGDWISEDWEVVESARYADVDADEAPHVLALL